ncbi:MAG TPA: hypothetical protein VFZ61_28855 [Polyangiales bacterium]
MARVEHDGEREREQNSQDHQGDGDAEAAASLRRLQRGQQRRGGLGLYLAALGEAGQQLVCIEIQCTRIRTQEAAREHVSGELFKAVLLDALKHAQRHARRLHELFQRYLAQLAFTTQKRSDGIHAQTPQCVASRYS